MTDITSFEDFHKAFGSYRTDNTWMFRGQADVDWSLIPKAGRKPYNERDDLDSLEAWSRRATEFIRRPLGSVWEHMALAQHHGLPTRLLDWTYNPLVAAFFACAEEPKADAVVYCCRLNKRIYADEAKPDTLKRVMKYRPNVIADRIGRQSGLFSVHPEPKKDMREALWEGESLEFHVIKAKYKTKMLFELNHYGINRLTLMGDLDGLSAHIRWTIENRRYWADHDEFIREICGDAR